MKILFYSVLLLNLLLAYQLSLGTYLLWARRERMPQVGVCFVILLSIVNDVLLFWEHI